MKTTSPCPSFVRRGIAAIMVADPARNGPIVLVERDLRARLGGEFGTQPRRTRPEVAFHLGGNTVRMSDTHE